MIFLRKFSFLRGQKFKNWHFPGGKVLHFLGLGGGKVLQFQKQKKKTVRGHVFREKVTGEGRFGAKKTSMDLSDGTVGSQKSFIYKSKRMPSEEAQGDQISLEKIDATF